MAQSPSKIQLYASTKSRSACVPPLIITGPFRPVFHLHKNLTHFLSTHTDHFMADEQIHFLLIPFMAQGHTIPMVDIAKLLAQRGVKVTLLLTPRNLIRLRPVLARANELGLAIHVAEIYFPAEEAGLPAGCENFDSLPSTSLAVKFFSAVELLRPQVKTLVSLMDPKPRCLLADICFAFTSDLARQLGIPRIVFHGMCSFARLCVHQIASSKILEHVDDETKVFEVPEMPDKISFRVSQVRGMISSESKEWKEFQDNLAESEKLAYGVVFNTFEDLESRFIDKYTNVKEKKVWTIGPVSMCNEEYTDKITRGNISTNDIQECSKWLELQEHGSVLYACLGSICNLTAAQMLELGLGLEASDSPFIWVIRTGGGSNYEKDLKQMMEQNGFEERLMKNSKKGFVIWGWAPQVLLLSHPSVGGFLTHCGWNSSLEGIVSGLPMLTWPLFGDQFYNEKLVVDVLGIGVRIGVQKMMQFGKEDEIGVMVSRERVKESVEDLMDEGEDGKVRRERVEELALKAKRAVDEGGSSHVNIGKLIEDVRNFKA